MGVIQTGINNNGKWAPTTRRKVFPGGSERDRYFWILHTCHLGAGPPSVDLIKDDVTCKDDVMFPCSNLDQTKLGPILLVVCFCTSSGLAVRACFHNLFQVLCDPSLKPPAILVQTMSHPSNLYARELMLPSTSTQITYVPIIVSHPSPAHNRDKRCAGKDIVKGRKCSRSACKMPR